MAAQTRIATPPTISHEPVITITSHPDRCADPATIRSAPKFSIDRAAMTSQNTGAAMTTSMTRPRLLDLFCGAGGAAMGYHRAGFDVVGVDIKPQPRYPFLFVRADAMTYPLDGFDVIHASPPCQAFTQMSARWRGKGTKADTHPDLLTPMRRRLAGEQRPWIIENVTGAARHMSTTLTLHGGMFGLGVHRPRRFESNALLLGITARQTRAPVGVYGTKPDGRTTYKGKSLIRAAKSLEEASEVMGIDWMTWEEIREAIPPAYTEYIGAQLIDHLRDSCKRP